MRGNTVISLGSDKKSGISFAFVTPSRNWRIKVKPSVSAQLYCTYSVPQLSFYYCRNLPGN